MVRSFLQQVFGLTPLAVLRGDVSFTVVALENSSTVPFEVLIAGAGVAGLECMLALRELAGERVGITVLAPDEDFVYRPMRVREPFGYSTAERHPLDEIVRDAGAELLQDQFARLDAPRSTAHTASGRALPYDALLLALGAQLHPAFGHCTTIDDRRLDEQLHGLIQDIEGGFVASLAFVAPTPMAWPLPIYELALMTATRAFDMGARLSITIVTPEDAPLALFGTTVSDAVRQLLEERDILTITSAHAGVLEPGRVSIHPGERTLHVDRIVALPQLSGPATPGVPSGEGGFIPIDVHCRVRGLEHVYAAGDATDFPVKHGGVAAQQADAAAAEIAALAGVAIEPQPFHPAIQGVLFGGPKPLYLSAHITGGHGSTSQVSETPTWSPPGKIAAKYLGPYLASRGHVTADRP